MEKESSRIRTVLMDNTRGLLGIRRDECMNKGVVWSDERGG